MSCGTQFHPFLKFLIKLWGKELLDCSKYYCSMHTRGACVIGHRASVAFAKLAMRGFCFQTDNIGKGFDRLQTNYNIQKTSRFIYFISEHVKGYKPFTIIRH